MNYNQQAQGKPHSLQEQGYNCDGCSRSIPSGQEAPRFVVSYTEIRKCLFCSSCKIYRGYELSKPFHDPNLDLKKMKMTEAPNFEGYMNNKHFSENTKKLAKELEDDWQEKLKKGGKKF